MLHLFTSGRVRMHSQTWEKENPTQMLLHRIIWKENPSLTEQQPKAEAEPHTPRKRAKLNKHDDPNINLYVSMSKTVNTHRGIKLNSKWRIYLNVRKSFSWFAQMEQVRLHRLILQDIKQ